MSIKRSLGYSVVLLLIVTAVILIAPEPQMVTTSVTSPQRGLASGTSLGNLQLLNATWAYNWGVWSNRCESWFVPLIPSYYTYLDKETWEEKIVGRAKCAPGNYWLVGNEPNSFSTDSDGGHQPNFDPLMKSYNWAIETIYQYDPQAKIILGGIVGADQDFYNQMKNALKHPVAGWHFHLYNYPDLGGFQSTIDWWTGQPGEIWLTEWGVLQGTGQLDWMKKTLPIVQASRLARYAWFKTTPSGWNVPLSLVDNGLTELGKLYSGQTNVQYLPMIEAEAYPGTATISRNSSASECMALQFSGVARSEYRFNESGMHVVYIRAMGKDWGSDSFFVTVNGVKMTVDVGHDWGWVAIRDRGEYTERRFRFPATVIVETREPGALLDVIALDSPVGTRPCGEPIVTTPMPTVVAHPTFTVEERLKTLEEQVAELQARQAELWEIVTGGQQ